MTDKAQHDTTIAHTPEHVMERNPLVFAMLSLILVNVVEPKWMQVIFGIWGAWACVCAIFLVVRGRT